MNFALLTGTKKVKSESITCSSLKRERHYDSGYYILKDESEAPRLGYCDMNVVDYIENGSSGSILGTHFQTHAMSFSNNLVTVKDTGTSSMVV